MQQSTPARNVDSTDQIKMAEIIVTLKVMPDSPDVDLEALETTCKEKISAFGGEVGKVDVEPIAFGLNAVNLIFVMDESKGATDPLEEEIAALETVTSAEVTDVRRAIG